MGRMAAKSTLLERATLPEKGGKVVHVAEEKEEIRFPQLSASKFGLDKFSSPDSANKE